MGRERRPVKQDEQGTPAQSPLLFCRPRDTGLEAGCLGPQPPDSPGSKGSAMFRASPPPPSRPGRTRLCVFLLI